MTDNVMVAYSTLGGDVESSAIHAEPKYTERGTPYLQQPGLALIAKTQVQALRGLKPFLDGFDPDLHFDDYLNDFGGVSQLTPGSMLTKVAGQLCYMSFGPGRTKNADAQRYLDNLKKSGHGSVFEHVNYTFLCYGISRSLTHELVRHRAGFGFSQVSQRYVDEKILRFVERPEFQQDPELHSAFIRTIDQAAINYAWFADMLLGRQRERSIQSLSGEARTELRKKVNQAARAVLPNETEAPIIVTANARAWRHFIEMRANEGAELEIRALAFRIFLCLAITDPMLFSDYEIVELSDGTNAVQTPWRKV